MEGNRLTHDQTRYIYETNTIGIQDATVNVDDVVETVNHFRCVDLVIEQANYTLSEAFIKQLHSILKTGTSDSRKEWFAVGDYKRFENEVGGKATAKPDEVADKMKALLRSYNRSKKKSLKEIVAFHYKFERIHPFQDGNGRTGRMILFRESLKYDELKPFIILDDDRSKYLEGLKEYREHHKVDQLLELMQKEAETYYQECQYFIS